MDSVGSSDRLDLQVLFVDPIAVCVLNPCVVTNSSQVLGQAQCVFWVMRIYLRAAAWTCRLHKLTHRLHPTLRVGERTILAIYSKKKRRLAEQTAASLSALGRSVKKPNLIRANF